MTLSQRIRTNADRAYARGDYRRAAMLYKLAGEEIFEVVYVAP